MRLKFKLWWINKWLRWTGLRLFVQVPLDESQSDDNYGPTWIGIRWYGWPKGDRGDEPEASH